MNTERLLPDDENQLGNRLLINNGYDPFESTKIMCPICYERLPSYEMLRLPCGHKVMEKCLSEYFLTLLDNNQI
jgi:hypothetical protein